MQIASMFASLGFKVDTSGLEKFKASVSSARSEFSNLNQGVKQASKHLRSLQSSIKSVDTALNKIRGAGANSKIISSYSKMAKALEEVDKHLINISTHQSTTTKAIGKINASVHAGSKKWEQYVAQVRKATNSLKTVTATIKGAGASKVISSYEKLASSVKKVDTHLKSIAKHQPVVSKAIGKINSSVISGTKNWIDYADAINKARNSLRQVRSRVRDLQNNNDIIINIRERRRGGGGFGGGSGGSNGGGGNFGGGVIGGLLGSVMPSALLGGGVASIGYAGAQIVKQGQEQTRMELALQMSSKDINEFRDSLKYVKEEALRLGLTSQELGKAFAQVNMAAEGLTQEKKKEIFTGLNEYMATMQLNPEKQKGVYTAMYQMFSKGKISQEEIGQLAERGFSQKVFRDAIKQAYGLKSSAEAIKMQEQGKLTDVGKIWEIYTKNLQKMARESGAFEKMLTSSSYNINKFKETLVQLFKEIMDSGVDEFLGSVFKSLTGIVPLLSDAVFAIKELVTMLKLAKEGLDEMTGGFGLTSIVLLLLLGRFRGFIRGVKLATALIKRKRGALVILNGFMRGVFGRTLGLMITRFGLWGLAITAVTQTLAYLGKELKKYKSGDYNIFEELAHQSEMFGLEIDLVMVKLQLMWEKVKLYATTNPTQNLVPAIKRSFKDAVSSDAAMIAINPSAAAANYAFRALQAVDKIRNIVDTDASEVINKSQSSQSGSSVTLQNNIYVDGKLSNNQPQPIHFPMMGGGGGSR